MRRLAIVQAIHLGSRRVPRKLLEPVGDHSLLEIGLSKLKALESLRDVSSVFAVSYADRELREAIDAQGFERIEIGTVAAEADSYAAVFTEWTNRLPERFDWAIDANIICRPFLRLETLVSLVDRALAAEHPFVACLEERGLLWDDRGEFLLGSGQVADTKKNPKYRKSANLAYAHPADMWDEQTLAAQSRPEVFPLLPLEQIDIDTFTDLEFARIVEAGQRGRAVAAKTSQHP